MGPQEVLYVLNTIDEDLYKEWVVKPCTCGQKKCCYSVIWHVSDRSGLIRTNYAEHIVELHNQWVKENENRWTII